MEFMKDIGNEKKNNLSFIETEISTEPHINVLSKEEFETRIEKVFNILWEKS